MKPILLVAETIDDVLQPSQLELLGAARVMNPRGTRHARWVVYGREVLPIAQMLARRSGLDCIALTHAQLRTPHPALLAAALQPLIEDLSPAVIVLLHTLRAVQAAATLALKLEAACVTAVQSIRWEGDRPVFHRAVLGGKLGTAVVCRRQPAIVTVLPGVFSHQLPTQAAHGGGAVQHRAYAGQATGFRVTGIDRRDEAPQPVDRADVVVAAGRGVGPVENLGRLEALCAIFNRAALAGSRLVCDQGWLPHACQVGETGRRVAPRLYIACGISGARQHLVGMQHSECIVAINTDPHAPIFAHADMGIVEDLDTFVPLLLERYHAFCERLCRGTPAA
jgi:electron transfer flavoprotein alpha subunit